MKSKASLPVGDALHLMMMLAALSLAYFLPFELVLLSYAILGPLHYLTEISWLHDRHYFIRERSLAWILVVCAALLLLLQMQRGIAGMILYVALAFSIAFTSFETTRARVIVIAIGLLAGLTVVNIASLNVPLVILLPTVIHVSLFTLLFMIVGALKNHSMAQFLLVGAYILCVTAILVWPPSAVARLPAFADLGTRYFGTIGPAIGQVFGANAWPFDARLAGFLSFIYTYHYLNWFIKVRVIRWNDVPKMRLALIAILGCVATAIYFINSTIGIVVLVSLSLLHVLLEFPLNVISIREIGGMMISRRRIML